LNKPAALQPLRAGAGRLARTVSPYQQCTWVHAAVFIAFQ